MYGWIFDRIHKSALRHVERTIPGRVDSYSWNRQVIVARATTAAETAARAATWELARGKLSEGCINLRENPFSCLLEVYELGAANVGLRRVDHNTRRVDKGVDLVVDFILREKRGKDGLVLGCLAFRPGFSFEGSEIYRHGWGQDCWQRSRT